MLAKCAPEWNANAPRIPMKLAPRTRSNFLDPLFTN